MLSTLAEWLALMAQIPPFSMVGSIERVMQVGERLQVTHPQAKIVTVAGTNGKGSTVFGLESIYRAAGFRTGLFSSPYLFQYEEQVKINGESVLENQLVDALNRVESVRADILLTPFERLALAAFIIFQDADLDVWILEVGLGGRYDAVNILNPNLSVITSISLDHTAILGETREAIAIEKAGIFRKGIPIIIGDPDPPQSLIQLASDNQSHVSYYGTSFSDELNEDKMSWNFYSNKKNQIRLPINSLSLQNMAMVVEAIRLMQSTLPVNDESIVKGLSSVHLPGRMQMVQGKVKTLYDVAHNEASVKWLIEKIKTISRRHVIAVFSMLADKDIKAVVNLMKPFIYEWYIAELNPSVKRRATLDLLQSTISPIGLERVTYAESLQHAASLGEHATSHDDLLIVFGSFHTVNEVAKALHASL